MESIKFEFQVGAKSDLLKLVEAFETDVPLARLLGRAKLINDERFLYLMEGELIIED